MISVFQCEDSLDGILTGVYEAWDSRLGHHNVRLELSGEGNLELFCTYHAVHTDISRAEKVLGTVGHRMGEEAKEHICRAAACRDDRKADAIYRMIVLGLHLPDGRQIVNCLTDPNVSLVMRFSQKVWNEVHRMMQFVRFEELESGVLYAKIAPVHGVLPLTAPHFADRYAGQGWLIVDEIREIAAVHRKGEQWFLAEGLRLDAESLKCLSDTEEDFQKLWKSFCESIAIQERKNPNLQRNLLPLRYRSNMTEFQDSPEMRKIRINAEK